MAMSKQRKIHPFVVIAEEAQKAADRLPRVPRKEENNNEN